MHNHIFHLLKRWYPLRKERNWVLACITSTVGSVYRKTGTLMLFSERDQLGMVSGGCLENHLHTHAMRVADDGKIRTVIYDGSDESNIAWELGIGCGGKVEITIFPCNAENQFMDLDTLHSRLAKREKTFFKIEHKNGTGKCFSTHPVQEAADTTWISFVPPIHLVIFGAGRDMLPAAEMATSLGWQVSIVEPRGAHQRQALFPSSVSWQLVAPDELNAAFTNSVDAAIIATHNMQLDAEAITWSRRTAIRYCGLLGPRHRTTKLLETLKLTRQDLPFNLSNPMGLNLGGELPESIALAAIAECHAKLYKRDALPLSEQEYQQ